MLADGVPLIGLMDLAADQSNAGKAGIRITLKLIDGKDGRTLDSRDELVQKNWSRRQQHSNWHYRKNFKLHALPENDAGENASENSSKKYRTARTPFAKDGLSCAKAQFFTALSRL